MLRPYNLLENILIDIERNIREDINSNILADKYSLSDGHLRRLFKFSFKQNIAEYIRARKLSASLDELFNTDLNIIDIALSYGYSYEQTYIRAFKDEFGSAPGELRKTGQIVKVKPPLYLFDENKLEESVLFGPDIVMVPKFHIAGKSHIIPYDESVTLAPKVAIHFWENDRKHINNVKNPNVYIGLTCNNNYDAMNSEYITSVIVSDLEKLDKNSIKRLDPYLF
jgi:AraC family transcriptional regulator